MKNYLPEIQQHDDELDAVKAHNNYQPCWFKPEGLDFAIYPKPRRDQLPVSDTESIRVSCWCSPQVGFTRSMHSIARTCR